MYNSIIYVYIYMYIIVYLYMSILCMYIYIYTSICQYYVYIYICQYYVCIYICTCFHIYLKTICVYCVAQIQIRGNRESGTARIWSPPMRAATSFMGCIIGLNIGLHYRIYHEVTI